MELVGSVAQRMALPWTGGKNPLQRRTEDATFLDHLNLRFQRRCFRDMAGHALDRIVPLPESWLKRIQQWATPKAALYGENYVQYSFLLQSMQEGKPLYLSDYFKKTLLYGHLSGFFTSLADGGVFRGFSRLGLMAFSGFQIVQRGLSEYRKTRNPWDTTKAALHEAGRWIIGAEVSAIGFALGTTFSNKQSLLTGLMMSLLASAAFDTLWMRKAPNSGFATGQRSSGLLQKDNPVFPLGAYRPVQYRPQASLGLSRLAPMNRAGAVWEAWRQNARPPGQLSQYA